MMTTTIPVEINCPDWCTESADSHAAELWEWEGNCIHRSANWTAEDTIGHHRGAPWEPPSRHDPAHVHIATCARPDGRETASCEVHFHVPATMGIQQSLDFADAIRAAVEAYRANGGIE